MQSSIERQIAQVNKESVPASQALTQASLAASENRMVIYKHVTSTTETEMQAMEAILSKNAKLFDESTKLYYSLPKTPEAEAIIEKIKAAIAGIRAVRGTMLADSRKATSPEDVAKLVLRVRKDYDPHSDALSNHLAALQELEQGLVRNRCEAMSAAAQRIRLGLMIGGASILVIAIAAGIIISSRINKALVGVSDVLRDASAQVGNASGQVASSSQALAQGSTEQAASLEETSASLEELGGMTKRNADSAQHANALAREAREATDAGAAQVTELVEAMEAIKTSSSNIAAIIKTIDEVAFQTNILALNAAVEAARAGEAGAGFAVVAEEVRNLAQRAAGAARETAEKIDDSINKSTRGAEVSERVSKSLTVIAEKVRQVDGLVGEIAVASKEQAQGLGQIGTAVTQMDQITQKNAGVSEETASAAQELNSQAQVLTNAVAGLRAMVLRE